MLRCMNHAVNLVILSLLNAIEFILVTDMYAGALFLRMGGHFLRLVSVVHKVVSEKLTRITKPTPRDAALANGFWLEMIN